MKYDSLDPESTALKLSSRVYSASEVASSVHISPDVLTNYLVKTKLTLCSEAQGRGKSRKFHILDIYALSIMKGLVDLTGKQDWSARVVEYLLFLREHRISHQTKPLDMRSDLKKVREEFLFDFRQTRPLFWQRKWHDNAWVLFIDAGDVRGNLYGFDLFHVGGGSSLLNNPNFLLCSNEGHHLNLTWRLTEIDKRLCEIVGNTLW